MNIYKKLLAYTPERNHFGLLAVLCSVIATVMNIIPFWFLWKFLQALLMNQNIDQSRYYATIIVLFMLGYALSYFFALSLTHFLAFRLETNLRKAGIKHLMNASFSFFDKQLSGRVRKLIDDNATETHTIVAHLIPDLVSATSTPILMLIVTFMVDYRLGILLLIICVASAVLLMSMMGDQAFMKYYMEALEKMNSEAVEYVRGMQVLKIFRTTLQSFKAFYECIMKYSEYAYNYTLSCRTPYVLYQVIMTLFVTIMIPAGIILISKGEDSSVILAKIIFFMCFSGTLFTAIMRIMYVSMYQFQAAQAVNKLENLFTEMSEDALVHGTDREMNDYTIEFKEVSFGYEEERVLQNFNLKLEPSKSYALVGSSGSGKSTIAKLISGFYRIQEGSILIGGKPIESYHRDTLMKNIAFVFQNTKLFKTSIYENVKMGNPSASYEEVMQALKLAQCNEILDKLKDRENTVIGSKGIHLSGGETQRIAIARAILKNANIIILDEASAAADPENEYEIQLAFSNLMKNKTVIMIAHRLSSIRNVDHILVIDGGKVIEEGTDSELMQKNGRYKYLQEMFSKANDWRVYD